MRGEAKAKPQEGTWGAKQDDKNRISRASWSVDLEAQRPFGSPLPTEWGAAARIKQGQCQDGNTVGQEGSAGGKTEVGGR